MGQQDEALIAVAHHACIHMQTIKDWHLVLFVVFLVGIDVTILIITAAIPSLRLRARIVPNQEKQFEESEVSVLL